ncbi:mannonate dehydratase [Membranihabitans maritimus]|uniref:mannonate dehydratase n=1 Tax=Membranihabitans maritimus TaxID=2904244 RepID=UPI001F002688
MKIAEVLPIRHGEIWTLAGQAGVSYSVSRLPMDDDGNPSVEYLDLLQLRNKHRDYGYSLEVIEPDLNWQLNKFKLNLEGGDEEIEACKKLIRNMGALGIPVLCYNFMAHFNWVRTSFSVEGRGGALVSEYDHSQVENSPTTRYGIIGKDFLWERLELFLKEVIPVAEQSKVRLAIHPDDPPVDSIQGISRIITSFEDLKKVITLVPSAFNGITLCQGTISAMGENVTEVIRELGSEKKVFYVHFRDVSGSAQKFVETFHDEGQTDMYETVKNYIKIGFDGPVRIDHVPTMEGENNTNPGYETKGRLFALGYLKGLFEAALKEVVYETEG